MAIEESEANSFHWPMDMLESVEVGLVVLDLDFRVEVWTWGSKNLLSQRYTNTQDFVVDISGNPKERYIITLHLANQVLTRNVTITPDEVNEG